MLSHAMKSKLVSILYEDLDKGDVTSALLKPRKCRARIVAKEKCVVAGLEEARFLFNYRKVKAVAKVKDGTAVSRGKTVMVLNGLNSHIFEVERTALNIISRMSAVASACVEAKKIAGKKVTAALTRKTLPGFNIFDKKCGVLAGIWTHRTNLNDAVLIKDNHLLFFSSSKEAVEKAREHYSNEKTIEVEADTLQQALNAASAKPDIIMLDNFPPKRARKAVKELRKSGFKGKIELSGGIDLSNLRKYAAAGADIISMGCLTHSVIGKNFSLEIVK